MIIIFLPHCINQGIKWKIHTKMAVMNTTDEVGDCRLGHDLKGSSMGLKGIENIISTELSKIYVTMESIVDITVNAFCYMPLAIAVVNRV